MTKSDDESSIVARDVAANRLDAQEVDERCSSLPQASNNALGHFSDSERPQPRGRASSFFFRRLQSFRRISPSKHIGDDVNHRPSIYTTKTDKPPLESQLPFQKYVPQFDCQISTPRSVQRSSTQTPTVSTGSSTTSRSPIKESPRRISSVSPNCIQGFGLGSGLSSDIEYNVDNIESLTRMDSLSGNIPSWKWWIRKTFHNHETGQTVSSQNTSDTGLFHMFETSHSTQDSGRFNPTFKASSRDVISPRMLMNCTYETIDEDSAYCGLWSQNESSPFSECLADVPSGNVIVRSSRSKLKNRFSFMSRRVTLNLQSLDRGFDRGFDRSCQQNIDKQPTGIQGTRFGRFRLFPSRIFNSDHWKFSAKKQSFHEDCVSSPETSIVQPATRCNDPGGRQLPHKNLTDVTHFVEIDRDIIFEDADSPSNTLGLKIGGGTPTKGTRQRIRARATISADSISGEEFDEALLTGGFADGLFISEEEVHEIRETVWTPKGNVPKIDLKYHVAWDLGKKGCIAVKIRRQWEAAINPTRMRFFLMDGTDPYNFLWYYTKADLKSDNPKAEKAGVIRARDLLDAEWDYDLSRVKVNRAELGGKAMIIDRMPRHFFEAMIVCLREMEVCRVVNARKVQRKKQRDDLEARIAQRRSSPIQSRVSNGTAFDETGLDSRNDRIGAARKRARAMVIPNSGVVASVIASSVKRQSLSRSSATTTVSNTSTGRRIGWRYRRFKRADNTSYGEPSDFSSYLTSKSETMTFSASLPEGSLDSSYFNKLLEFPSPDTPSNKNFLKASSNLKSKKVPKKTSNKSQRASISSSGSASQFGSLEKPLSFESSSSRGSSAARTSPFIRLASTKKVSSPSSSRGSLEDKSVSIPKKGNQNSVSSTGSEFSSKAKKPIAGIK